LALFAASPPLFGLRILLPKKMLIEENESRTNYPSRKKEDVQP
jgi:hypothetical protein